MFRLPQISKEKFCYIRNLLYLCTMLCAERKMMYQENKNMEGYYRSMIEHLPEDADYFVQEYKDNTLSIEEMRQIHDQQQKEWGYHTVRDINLIKDKETGLYYAHVFSMCHQGLLYEHLMLEQLYAQKENVDWQRVTDGYDYREIKWIRDILTHPLVWVPVEEVENECVVVGKVAREEPRPDAISDRHIYTFCWELEKKGLLWFADTMPVLNDVHQVGRLEYEKLPEDMVLWDRLICGHLFKTNPNNMHRNIEYIAEQRGAAKAVEIVERFREDWQDILTLRLFNLWEAEDFEVQRLHRAMFEEMDRQLRIWKKKADNISESTNKPGPKKKSLFRDEHGDRDEGRTQNEKTRILSYIANHHLGNEEFDSSISSKLNIVVAYFWKIWSEKGLVDYYSARGEGTAFYRFLTEDCELTCPVEEKAFIRIVRSIIEDKHIDQEIYSNVAASFKSN